MGFRMAHREDIRQGGFPSVPGTPEGRASPEPEVGFRIAHREDIRQGGFTSVQGRREGKEPLSIGSYASPSLPWQRHNTIPLTPDLNCATASSLRNTNAISRQQQWSCQRHLTSALNLTLPPNVESSSESFLRSYRTLQSS